jgi:phospholipid transport system substrate-binding protein
MRTRLLAVAIALAPLAAVAGTSAGPRDQLLHYNKQLDAELKKKPAAGSAEAEVNRTRIKTLAGELFDYAELAHRSLAQHWDKLTPAQRDEFVSTMKEMIEKNYVKQLRTNLDYEVQYKDEAVNGEEATVSTIIKVRTKGKSTDAAIDYKMHKVASGWRVYDVITDEVSMVKNYRQQFNKIITTESYDALVKKMRKRIDDLTAEK